MEVCEAATSPVLKVRGSGRWTLVGHVHGLSLLLVATVGMGFAWRLVRYFGQFPIWGDEAMLLLNFLDRDFAGLMQHLRYSQVAPLFFLWLEKIAILTFGPAEWSVHLFPFLAGTGALVIFWRMCRFAVAPLAAGFAVGILAVSYYPVRHGCEVKPYAFDLLSAVAFVALALRHDRAPGQTRWLIGLIFLTPLAVFASYPSVFVAGSVSLALLPGMRTASWKQRGLFVLFNLVLLTSFLGHQHMVAQHQFEGAGAEQAREFLRRYWKDAFPPDHALAWPPWLLQIFTGNMLAYPIGAQHGGSTASFLLVLAGSVALWRNRERFLLALCWLPFAFNLTAAVLGKYPFGESARVSLHLAPFICILMANGIAWTISQLRTQTWQLRAQTAIWLFLLACGIAGIARDLVKPYKTEHDRDIRQFARELTEQAGPHQPVVLCHHSDAELLAELAWYLRTQPIALHWHGDLPADASEIWLVRCSPREPQSAQTAAMLNDERWRIIRSDVRCIPPENGKMTAVYCQKILLQRD